jgi:hypothetical protein
LGATCHVWNSAKELQGQEKISEQVCVGKSHTFVHVTMQGMVYLETKDGAKLKLLKVKYSPDFEKWITSIGYLLDQGYSVTKMTAMEKVILSQDKKRSITADRTSSSKPYYLLFRALEGQKQDQVFS